MNSVTSLGFISKSLSRCLAHHVPLSHDSGIVRLPASGPLPQPRIQKSNAVNGRRKIRGSRKMLLFHSRHQAAVQKPLERASSLRAPRKQMAQISVDPFLQRNTETHLVSVQDLVRQPWLESALQSFLRLLPIDQ